MTRSPKLHWRNWQHVLAAWLALGAEILREEVDVVYFELPFHDPIRFRKNEVSPEEQEKLCDFHSIPVDDYLAKLPPDE